MDFENGIDFSHLPAAYWSNKTKISYLQRRIIVYSIMYYELNESCISDKSYDAIAKQLVMLQNASDRSEWEGSEYYYAMYDFDGSTGFDIPQRLNDHDRKYLTDLAMSIYKQHKMRLP